MLNLSIQGKPHTKMQQSNHGYSKNIASLLTGKKRAEKKDMTHEPLQKVSHEVMYKFYSQKDMNIRLVYKRYPPAGPHFSHRQILESHDIMIS